MVRTRALTILAAALGAGAALVSTSAGASWTNGVGRPTHIAQGATQRAATPTSVRTAGPGFSHTRTVTRAKDPSLTAGYCKLEDGPLGDAFPAYSSTQTAPYDMDSLDLLLLGARDDGTNLQFEMVTASLHSGPNNTPMIYGRADGYSLGFGLPNNKKVFASIEYPGKPDPTNPNILDAYLSWGYSIPPPAGAWDFADTVGTGTATMDTSTDTVQFSIPLASLGISSGDLLSGPDALTLADSTFPQWAQPDPNTPQFDGLSFIADHGLISRADYQVGVGCQSTGQ